MDELAAAKAMSALCETYSCPIITAAAVYVLGKVGKAKPRFIADGYHQAPRESASQLLAKVREPDRATRDLFAVHFGVSVAQQTEIEAAINRGDFERVAVLMPPTPDMAWYTTRFVECA